jgi:hypothetical protein
MPAADGMEALSAVPVYRVIPADLAVGPGVSLAIPAKMKPATRRTARFVSGPARVSDAVARPT